MSDPAAMLGERLVQAQSRKVINLSDDRMIGPGMHEHAAQEAVREDAAEASIYAMLAIASAINRLADAVNDFVATQQ